MRGFSSTSSSHTDNEGPNLYSTAFLKHVIIRENCSKNLNFNAEREIKSNEEENFDTVGGKRSTFSFKLLVRKCETFLYRLSAKLLRFANLTAHSERNEREEKAKPSQPFRLRLIKLNHF